MAKSKSQSATDAMLNEIRAAISRCKAPEKDTYEALVGEAEVWEMRLDELEAEEAGEDEE